MPSFGSGDKSITRRAPMRDFNTPCSRDDGIAYRAQDGVGPPGIGDDSRERECADHRAQRQDRLIFILAARTRAAVAMKFSMCGSIIARQRASARPTSEWSIARSLVDFGPNL